MYFFELIGISEEETLVNFSELVAKNSTEK